MKRREGKSIIEFGVGLVFIGLMVRWLFKSLYFRCVPGLTLDQSNLLLWGIWLLVIVLGLFLTPGRGRTWLALLNLANAPASLYFLIAYRHIYPRFAAVIWSILLLIVVGYSVIVIIACCQDLRAGKHIGRIGKFLRFYFYRLGMMIGCVLTVLFIGLYFRGLFGSPLLKPQVEASDPKVNERVISDEMETILLLQAHLWEDLTPRERLDVLQTVANIEAGYLGLPHELNVTSEILEENILGVYRDNTHSICVSADYLVSESALLMLHALTHEAYHAYEHRLVDVYDQMDPQAQELLIFDHIRSYKEEFRDYVDPKDDLIWYLYQRVELDSDYYADIAVERYYQAIEEYLNPEEP